MDYALGLFMAALAGAGFIYVGDAALYDNPRAFFNLI